MHAEKNFNPFAKDGPAAGPRFCNNPALPATPQLRGITPLVDPAVPGADIANAHADKTLADAKAGTLAATTQSIEEQMIAIGFTEFFRSGGGAPGGAAAPPAAQNAPPAAQNAPPATPPPATPPPAAPPAQNAAPPAKCQVFVTVTAAAGGAAAPTPAVPAPAPAADAAQDAGAPATDAPAADAPAADAAAPVAAPAADAGAQDAGAPAADAAAPASSDLAARCQVTGIFAEQGLDGDVQNIRFASKDANHGSALNIPIIAKAVCNEVGKRGAECATACDKAIADATAGEKGPGQADLFNAAFGLKTNFADVKLVKPN